MKSIKTKEKEKKSTSSKLYELLFNWNNLKKKTNMIICVKHSAHRVKVITTVQKQTKNNKWDKHCVQMVSMSNIRRTERVRGRRVVPRYTMAQEKEHETDQSDELTGLLGRKGCNVRHTEHSITEWDMSMKMCTAA